MVAPRRPSAGRQIALVMLLACLVFSPTIAGDAAPVGSAEEPQWINFAPAPQANAVATNMAICEQAVEEYCVKYHSYPLRFDAVAASFFTGGTKDGFSKGSRLHNPFTGKEEYPITGTLTSVEAARKMLAISLAKGVIEYSCIAGGRSYAIRGGGMDGKGIRTRNGLQQLVLTRESNEPIQLPSERPTDRKAKKQQADPLKILNEKQQLKSQVERCFKAKQSAVSESACRSLVDIMTSESSPYEADCGMDLMHYGESRFRAHDYRNALTAVNRSIHVIEVVKGHDGDNLLQPLFILGWIYDEMKDDTQLERTLLRQIHTLRKNPLHQTLMPNVLHEYAVLLRRTGGAPEGQAVEDYVQSRYHYVSEKH